MCGICYFNKSVRIYNFVRNITSHYISKKKIGKDLLNTFVTKTVNIVQNNERFK